MLAESCYNLHFYVHILRLDICVDFSSVFLYNKYNIVIQLNVLYNHYSWEKASDLQNCDGGTRREYITTKVTQTC